jgi:hypothetical protein
MWMADGLEIYIDGWVPPINCWCVLAITGNDELRY